MLRKVCLTQNDANGWVITHEKCWFHLMPYISSNKPANVPKSAKSVGHFKNFAKFLNLKWKLCLYDALWLKFESYAIQKWHYPNFFTKQSFFNDQPVLCYLTFYKRNLKNPRFISKFHTIKLTHAILKRGLIFLKTNLTRVIIWAI